MRELLDVVHQAIQLPLRVHLGLCSQGEVLGQQTPAYLTLWTGRWWDLKVFGNAKLPNNKFVNFQSPDSGAANGQSTDG